MIASLLAAAALAAAPASTEVTAGPGNALHGTLLAPAGSAKAPLVVIIPGSGPTDRDGDNRLGITSASYRLLAEALAERGIASVRVDKRGMFGSAAATANPNAVTIEDYAGDMRAWAEALTARTGLPCVWLLGHSEGALVAEAAVQKPSKVCGVILVSGGGRRLSDVIRAQLAANPGAAALVPDANRIIGELEAGRTVAEADIPKPLLNLFHPAVQGFLISMFSYDPQTLLKSYAGPVLVVQGTTDLQTSVEDAERLAAARPGIKLVKIEGVNHVLKAAPLDRAANFATYAAPDKPVAPAVPDAIAAFVKDRR